MRVLNHQLSQCICCFGCSPVITGWKVLYLLSFEDGQFSSLILLIAVQSFEDVSPKPCKLDKLLSCVLNSVGLLFTRLVWFFSSNFQHSAKTLCCLLSSFKGKILYNIFTPHLQEKFPIETHRIFRKKCQDQQPPFGGAATFTWREGRFQHLHGGWNHPRRFVPLAGDGGNLVWIPRNVKPWSWKWVQKRWQLLEKILLRKLSQTPEK